MKTEKILKGIYSLKVPAKPDGGEVTPAELAHDAKPFVEYVPDNHRMVATTTILRGILLLLVGGIEAAVRRVWIDFIRGTQSAAWLGAESRSESIRINLNTHKMQ